MTFLRIIEATLDEYFKHRGNKKIMNVDIYVTCRSSLDGSLTSVNGIVATSNCTKLARHWKRKKRKMMILLVKVPCMHLNRLIDLRYTLNFKRIFLEVDLFHDLH